MGNFIKWIAIKLMKNRLKTAKEQQQKIKNIIVKRAFSNLIKSYKDTIMFLQANN